jgi:hypothetical protein
MAERTRGVRSASPKTLPTRGAARQQSGQGGQRVDAACGAAADAVESAAAATATRIAHTFSLIASPFDEIPA